MQLLRPELYKLVRLLEVRARRQIHGRRQGGINFRGKGRGMEFRDVREYVSGDDIRLIDWNVTSRTGEIHVKEFYQERDIPVILFLDISESMVSNSEKLDMAFQLVLFLALLHNNSGNQAQVLLYSTEWEFYSEPIRTEAEIWRVAKKIQDKIDSRKGKIRQTDHLLPLKYLQDKVLARNLVYIISDFANYPEPDRWKPIVKRHEIHSIYIDDSTSKQLLRDIKDYFYFYSPEEYSIGSNQSFVKERDEIRGRELFRSQFYSLNPGKSWVTQLLAIMGDGV